MSKVRCRLQTKRMRGLAVTIPWQRRRTVVTHRPRPATPNLVMASTFRFMSSSPYEGFRSKNAKPF